MEDAFAVHELDGSEHLEHIKLDFLEGERVFLIFETFVQVHVHQFEDEGEFAWVERCVPLGSS